MDSNRPRRRAAPRSGKLANEDGMEKAYAGNLQNAMRRRLFLPDTGCNSGDENFPPGSQLNDDSQGGG
jgi:hypothetical protein